jgi:hypothetical protein
MTAREGRKLGVLALVVLAAGCATLQQIAALRRVDFDLDRLSGGRLANVDLSRIRSYEDLTAPQIALIGIAIARKDLPLAFHLHVSAVNPSDNQVTARLLAMDWSLFIEDQETISGSLTQAFSLPPGDTVDIPIAMSLNLLDFFGSQSRQLVDIALAAAGAGGSPTRISLRASPTVDTPVGPIRYPQPITILSRTIGTR